MNKTIYLITPLTREFPQYESGADFAGVDGGYVVLKQAGIRPVFVLGDFDSLPEDQKPPEDAFRAPVRKDETDTELAIAQAREEGYEQIIVWGALRRRLDHTLANIRLVTWKYPGVILQDEMQKVFALLPGEYEIEPDYRHLSFFAMEKSVFSEQNVSYPLDHARLDEKDMYTVSNAFLEGPARITVHSGRMLCVLSNYE